MNLVIRDRDATIDTDLLFERVASIYLDTLDETTKPLKTPELVHAICEKHPTYNAEDVGAALKTPEFDAYLKTRRQRHLIERTAAKLLAAEMGARVGVLALDKLQDRLEKRSDDIKTKDLIEAAKLGMTLNSSIDKDLTEATGDVKITMQIKDVLIGLPPERAAAIMAEYGRTMASPKAKAEIIDASGAEEE